MTPFLQPEAKRNRNGILTFNALRKGQIALPADHGTLTILVVYAKLRPERPSKVFLVTTI